MLTNKYRVLLVEDNPGDARLARDWLAESDTPFDTCHVTTLADGLAALSDSRVSAVVLDLNLPDSQGLGTLTRVRDAARGSPVIVLSGETTPALRSMALQAGAERVFVKDEIRLGDLPRALLAVGERGRGHETHWQVERLLDVTPDGIIVVDTKGVVEYVNRAALELFGRTREDFIGELVSFSVKDGEPTEIVIPRSGDPRICEMRVVSLEWQGRPAFLGSLRDVTEARSNAWRFKRLFQSGVVGIAVSDSSGKIVEANDSFLDALGYSKEELADGGLTWAKVTPPEGQTKNEETLAELRGVGSAKPRERELVRRDGTLVPVLAGVATLDGSGSIAVSVDLTERKEAEAARHRAEDALRTTEEQLRQAQKMEAVGRLAGGIAHDFNNVLSVILSYADLIAGSLRQDDPMRDDVDEIRKAGQRAARLTRQLLMFSRQQVMERKVLDLNETLGAMRNMLQRLLGEDVRLVVKLESSLGKVVADQGSIEQVVMNLVVNARDAMVTGGQLTIETANVELSEEYASTHAGITPGPHVMLAVTDTGVGIDKATQARIFEPFFTTKAKGKGTGLGLSTVFGVVHQSHGSVWVYSEVGRGTTVKVYLPRTDAAVTEVGTRGPTVNLRGFETVLLVEDEDEVRAVAASILRRYGYRVIEARNAGEALLISESDPQQIELLLSDVVMPQMSGPELAKRVSRARPSMRVLCMSGYTDDSIVRHGVLTEQISFLQKPFTPEGLARKVREVLDTPREAPP